MPHSKIAVVEGKWSDKTNLSVKSFFDLMSDLIFKTPHAYHYEMFCDLMSLKNIVTRMSRARGIKYIYIGAHGTPNNIKALGGSITRAELRSILHKFTGTSIFGVFLSTCAFGNEDNIDYLLRPTRDAVTSIKWIAGYTKDIDWIDSAALDMLFWNSFFSSEGSQIARIEYVASELKRLVPGLIKELGFCIYRRGPRADSPVVNLVTY